MWAAPWWRRHSIRLVHSGREILRPALKSCWDPAIGIDVAHTHPRRRPANLGLSCQGFRSQAGHVCDSVEDGRDALFAATRESTTSSSRTAWTPASTASRMVKAARAAGQNAGFDSTSIGGFDDRVDGLEAGGDDYLIKPFAFSCCWPAFMLSVAGPMWWNRQPPSRLPTLKWTWSNDG